VTFLIRRVSVGILLYLIYKTISYTFTTMIYTCEKCGKSFQHRGNFTRHLNRKTICKPSETEKPSNIKVCRYCGQKFTKPTNMYRHIRKSCYAIDHPNGRTRIFEYVKCQNKLRKKLLGTIDIRTKPTNNVIFKKDGSISASQVNDKEKRDECVISKMLSIYTPPLWTLLPVSFWASPPVSFWASPPMPSWASPPMLVSFYAPNNPA